MVEREEIKFDDLISQIFSNPEKWIKPYDYLPVSVVLIENLKINVTHKSLEFPPIELKELSKIFEPYLHGKTLTITFLNNIFISNEDKMTPTIQIKLADSVYITFIENTFDQVDLSLYGEGRNDQVITLNDNDFTTGRVIIVNTPLKASTKKALDSMDINCNTYFKNNILSRIVVGGEMRFSFDEGNHITFLDCERNISGFYWGRSEKLSTDEGNIDHHRELFVQLKTKAIENNDKFQELILNHEILRLETILLKDKKKNSKIWQFIQNWILLQNWKLFQNWEDFQDKTILWVGAVFSNHGTSWIRPILILFLINIFISLFIVYNLACADWQTGLFIFAELYNPLSNLGDSVKQIVDDEKDILFSPWVFATINAIQKFFFAGLAYETIRVFRRFTVK